MLFSIDGIDLTPYINETTYQAYSDVEFVQWKDGNYNKHRLDVSSKVNCSFSIALYGKNGINTAKFLEIINNNVKGNKLTVKIFVQNENRIKLCEVFYSIKPAAHRISDVGTVVDIFNVELEEV